MIGGRARDGPRAKVQVDEGTFPNLSRNGGRGAVWWRLVRAVLREDPRTRASDHVGLRDPGQRLINSEQPAVEAIAYDALEVGGVAITCTCLFQFLRLSRYRKLCDS